MTKEYEIEYTLADGRSVTILFEAEYEVVDNGIGAYEYWGARCVDKQLDYECEDAWVNDIVDENGDSVSVSDEEKKAIQQTAYDYAAENAPEYDGGWGFDYDERKDYD